jgi:hypothetical protein
MNLNIEEVQYMKNVAKLILTGIQILVWFVIILSAQYLTLAALALPSSGDVERVHLINCEGESVCYADAPGFWSANLDTMRDMGEPKWIIRDWFNWNWWQRGMKWADFTYTTVTEFVGPFVAPIYTADNMSVYHGYNATNADIALVISEKYNIPNDAVLLSAVTAVRNGEVDPGYAHGVLITYKEVHNIEFFIKKYSDPSFARYVDKFFDNNGEFKAVGTLLFYQVILAVILSVYFTYQLPIVIERNEMNETQVKTRIGPRMPKISFRRREKRLRRKEEGK